MKLKNYIEIIIIVLLVIYLLFWAAYQEKLSYNCSDFDNQYEAWKAYDRGAIRLDADGDGEPCEHLAK